MEQIKYQLEAEWLSIPAANPRGKSKTTIQNHQNAKECDQNQHEIDRRSRNLTGAAKTLAPPRIAVVQGLGGENESTEGEAEETKYKQRQDPQVREQNQNGGRGNTRSTRSSNGQKNRVSTNLKAHMWGLAFPYKKHNEKNESLYAEMAQRSLLAKTFLMTPYKKCMKIMNCRDPRHSNMKMTATNHTNDSVKRDVELSSMHGHN